MISNCANVVTQLNRQLNQADTCTGKPTPTFRRPFHRIVYEDFIEPLCMLGWEGKLGSEANEASGS